MSLVCSWKGDFGWWYCFPQGSSTFKKSGRPKEYCSQCIRPTYRCSAKNDIIERLIGMAKIGVTRKTCVWWWQFWSTFLSISYLTKDVKCVLNDLPTFSIIVQWGKQLKDVLNDFTFMNLLIYLVYGKDKSLYMQSLKAFEHSYRDTYKSLINI